MRVERLRSGDLRDRSSLTRPFHAIGTARKLELAFAGLLLGYCLYAALFIFRTSYPIGGVRYFSLFDDAMISMRYARNLAHGHGLVWNSGGERVEGYTNLLWTLYMAIFHLLPVAQSKVSVLIQVSAALLLLLNLVFVRAIASVISDGSPFVILGAVLLTAAYLPLNNWALQGTEVGLLTLLVSISTWKAIQIIRLRQFSAWPSLLLGVAALVRIDMVLPYLAVMIFLAWADETNRRRHVSIGLVVLLLSILPQTLFRIWYYGDVLPNTYYLKMTGYPLFLRLTRGLYVTLRFADRMNPLFFLLPFVLLVMRRGKAVVFCFWIFLVQVMYSIYVGGDAWESWGGSNRFVSVAMPIFFVLFCYGLEQVARLATERIQAKAPNSLEYARYGSVAILLVALVNFNAVNGPRSLWEWLLISRTLNVEPNAKYVRIGLLLREITSPRASVAVVWAGATPYFSERYAIDLLGKSDRKIAREPMHLEHFARAERLTAFWPGHLKWNLEYSIGHLRPDVVVAWYQTIPEEMPYAGGAYAAVRIQGIDLFLLNGSENVLWDKIPQQ